MGLVKVVAKVKVRDNGKNHAPGEEFEMEAGLAEVHERAGQVAIVGGAKQAAPASDKQQRGGANK